MVYELIGKISVFLMIVLAALFMLSLILGVILIKKKKFVLPKVLLFTIDTFYLQLKKVVENFGIQGKIIDQIGIDLRNHLSIEEFSSISPRDKIVVVPQCLRDLKCPARLDPASGIQCKECGKCVINGIKVDAERMGYNLFIVPGGRFVERIVMRVKPKAALGVACYNDLNIAMQGISRAGIVVQGVPLIRDGCMNTKVDIKEVINRMKLGIEGVSQTVRQCPETQIQV